MLVECPSSGISLEEMEDIPVIAVSANAIVESAGFRLRKASGLSVNRLKSVGMLGIGIDLLFVRSFRPSLK